MISWPTQLCAQQAPFPADRYLFQRDRVLLFKQDLTRSSNINMPLLCNNASTHLFQHPSSPESSHIATFPLPTTTTFGKEKIKHMLCKLS